MPQCAMISDYNTIQPVLSVQIMVGQGMVIYTDSDASYVPDSKKNKEALVKTSMQDYTYAKCKRTVLREEYNSRIGLHCTLYMQLHRVQKLSLNRVHKLRIKTVAFELFDSIPVDVQRT